MTETMDDDPEDFYRRMAAASSVMATAAGVGALRVARAAAPAPKIAPSHRGGRSGGRKGGRPPGAPWAAWAERDPAAKRWFMMGGASDSDAVGQNGFVVRDFVLMAVRVAGEKGLLYGEIWAALGGVEKEAFSRRKISLGTSRRAALNVMAHMQNTLAIRRDQTGVKPTRTKAIQTHRHRYHLTDRGREWLKVMAQVRSSPEWMARYWLYHPDNAAIGPYREKFLKRRSTECWNAERAKKNAPRESLKKRKPYRKRGPGGKRDNRVSRLRQAGVVGD